MPICRPFYSMKAIVNIILIISGLIPATYLLFMCLFMIGKILSDWSFDSQSTIYLIISIFGVFGYIGLILLLLEHRIRKRLIVTFLLMGILSFIIFIYQSGTRAWNWLITMEEPDEWFIFVWPSIVAFISIIRISLRPIFMNSSDK